MKQNLTHQLNQLLTWGKGETFYSLVNVDGKRWIMPARHMRVGMNLYQPSGPKGKLVKWALPWLYGNPMVQRVLHLERVQLALGADLQKLLAAVFGGASWEFSIFCGTPCVHQKITMQISRGKRILGYVKVTESEDIRQIFTHEEQVLHTLHQSGIEQVPECLYCGTLGDGLAVFVQSTIKTLHSKVVHQWDNRHWKFLTDMEHRTQRTVRFEDSDFCHDLDRLACLLPQETWVESVREAIGKVKVHYVGKDLKFSAFHADFTPWNMFAEKGQLYVFDWEYARLTYPACLDFFHFLVQTAVFEDHLTSEKVVHRYQQVRDGLKNRWDDPDFAFLCYLLAVMSIYVQREQGHMGDELKDRIRFWTFVLENIKTK